MRHVTEKENIDLPCSSLNPLLCMTPGFMPGPIVYGHLIDSTCVFWSDSCASSGYCMVYDNDKFRFLLHGVTAVLQGVAVLLYLLVWILVRREEKKLRFTKVNLEEDPPLVEKFSDKPSESGI